MDLVFERMNELGRAWFNAAYRARDGDPTKPRILPAQCVDQAMLDPTRTEFRLPGQDRFYLCRPSHMEYTPAPLTFVCRTCGLFQAETLAELDKNLDEPDSRPLSHNPKEKGQCDWEQLDVIFVHWSGHWEAAVSRANGSGATLTRKSSSVETTASAEATVQASTGAAAGIGDWFFECATCDKPLSPKWLQNDRDTLRSLARRSRSPSTEVRMQATPYRASSAYYVKSDLFIDFKDGSRDLLTRLRPGREDALKDFVAKQYGFGITEVTRRTCRSACEGKPECQKDLAGLPGVSAAIQNAETLLETAVEPMRTFILKC